MENKVAIIEVRPGHRIAVSGDADDIVAAALAMKERDELRRLCARLCRQRDQAWRAVESSMPLTIAGLFNGLAGALRFIRIRD